MTVTPGIKRITGNGDIIWKTNIDIPKNFIINLRKSILDPNRDKIDHDPSDEPQAQALQYKLIKCVA